MLKLSGGKSEKDRISFSSKYVTATAIRNSENGKIELDFEKRDKSISKSIAAVLLIFGSTSLVKALIITPLIKNGILGIAWFLLPAFFYLLIAILSISSVLMTGGEEFLRNHGAEHMVFSAYKHLKRIPTVEEAQHFSRINRACGIVIFSAFITSQLISFIVFARTGFVIPEIIVFLVPLLFPEAFPLSFLGKLAQFITTSKPQTHNLELAIAALTELEKRERFEKILDDAINNIFYK